MKLLFSSLLHRPVTALCALVVALASLTSARAQTVFLTFTGGNNTGEITITWSTPIVYTVNSTSVISGVNPVFVFRGIPNLQAMFPLQGPVGGVGPTYTSTGAGSTDGVQTVNRLTTPNTFNSVQSGDMVFFSNLDTAPTILTAGDIVTLSAGSLRYDGSPTSNFGYSGSLPANGYYTTFLTDGPDTYFTNLGSGVVGAVPEPSTYAALAGLGALGVAAWRRRGQRAEIVR